MAPEGTATKIVLYMLVKGQNSYKQIRKQQFTDKADETQHVCVD